MNVYVLTQHGLTKSSIVGVYETRDDAESAAKFAADTKLKALISTYNERYSLKEINNETITIYDEYYISVCWWTIEQHQVYKPSKQTQDKIRITDEGFACPNPIPHYQILSSWNEEDLTSMINEHVKRGFKIVGDLNMEHCGAQIKYSVLMINEF